MRLVGLFGDPPAVAQPLPIEQPDTPGWHRTAETTDTGYRINVFGPHGYYGQVRHRNLIDAISLSNRQIQSATRNRAA